MDRIALVTSCGMWSGRGARAPWAKRMGGPRVLTTFHNEWPRQYGPYHPSLLEEDRHSIYLTLLLLIIFRNIQESFHLTLLLLIIFIPPDPLPTNNVHTTRLLLLLIIFIPPDPSPTNNVHTTRLLGLLFTSPKIYTLYIIFLWFNLK